MGVGIQVGSIIDEVGTHDFLHSFFSTISYHLEPEGWGSRFPELMKEFYQGELKYTNSEKVLSDLKVIQSELRDYPPDKVIWDIENLNAKPPWGNNISEEITDLSNYFVTSTGKDLFAVIFECLEDSIENNRDVTIAKI